MRHGSQKTNHFDFAISPFYLTNLNYGTGYVLFDLWIDCDRTREQFRSERLRLRGLESILRIIIVCFPLFTSNMGYIYRKEFVER